MPRKTNGNGSSIRVKKVASVTPAVPRMGSAQSEKKAVFANVEEEIRRRAYEIYLGRGCSGGSEHDDWLTAERQVRESQSVGQQRSN
jgi:hypothetical protein